MKTASEILKFTLVCHGQFIPRDSRTWTAVVEAMETYRNQPPKSAGVKTVEEAVESLIASYASGDITLYNLLHDALTAQAKDFEARFKALCNYFSISEETASEITTTYLNQFRNQKPRG